MHRYISVCLAVVFLIAALPNVSSGQGRLREIGNRQAEIPEPPSPFSPDTASVWHKLGIPQSIGRFKKFRESRVNRNGDKPEKEKKKPPLKKLTDAANLAPDAPKMLQAAAEIKKAEDLAPQKIKALKYIATLGCGCYDKKNAGLIEAALLEGMDDCTPDVKREAISVVLQQVSSSGGCSCSCSCSCVTSDSGCNAKSCCTPKLYKKLEEIATKMDKTGCPVEPDASIRSLAQQALNACPYPMIEPEDEPEIIQAKPPVDKAVETAEKPAEDGGNSSQAEGDQGADSGELDLKGPNSGEDGFEQIQDDGSDFFDSGNDGDNAGYSSRRQRVQPVGYRIGSRSTGVSYTIGDSAPLNRLEVTGVVRTTRSGKREVTIVFDEAYDFPYSLPVILANSNGETSYGAVRASKPGTAIVQLANVKLINSLKPASRIRLGVFE